MPITGETAASEGDRRGPEGESGGEPSGGSRTRVPGDAGGAETSDERSPEGGNRTVADIVVTGKPRNKKLNN